MEVSDSVSHGLNFQFVGSMSENSRTIDDPSKFRGLITTHFIPNDFDPQSGFVNFVGVHATGANMDGKRIVDTIRIYIYS